MILFWNFWNKIKSWTKKLYGLTSLGRKVSNQVSIRVLSLQIESVPFQLNTNFVSLSRFHLCSGKFTTSRHHHELRSRFSLPEIKYWLYIKIVEFNHTWTIGGCFSFSFFIFHLIMYHGCPPPFIRSGFIPKWPKIHKNSFPTWKMLFCFQ